MLEALLPQPADPLLGITAACKADTHPRKLDLGVGIYRDEAGRTPVMRAVATAANRLLETQTTKAYVGPGGNREFAAAIEHLVLGADHPALAAGRVATLQTVGGCGGLRLAAELLKSAGVREMAVSAPTWGNHVPLLSSAGLTLSFYPYYDARAGRIEVERILEALETLPARSAVLLQASCHNPTGADLDADAWDAVAERLQRRGLLPLIDVAYQGLGDGLDADVRSVRALAARLPEVLVAVSCSKSFGLYRERTGTVMCIGASATQAEVAMGNFQTTARRMYSMPPDWGAAIVATVLTDPALARKWREELDGMRLRVRTLRRDLADALQTRHGERFEFIRQQRGMFSLLGVDADEVRALRERHHVYAAVDGRINIAGMRAADVPVLASALDALAPPGARA